MSRAWLTAFSAHVSASLPQSGFQHVLQVQPEPWLMLRIVDAPWLHCSYPGQKRSGQTVQHCASRPHTEQLLSQQGGPALLVLSSRGLAVQLMKAACRWAQAAQSCACRCTGFSASSKAAQPRAGRFRTLRCQSAVLRSSCRPHLSLSAEQGCRESGAGDPSMPWVAECQGSELRWRDQGWKHEADSQSYVCRQEECRKTPASASAELLRLQPEQAAGTSLGFQKGPD